MAYTALVSAVLVCSVLCAAAVCPNNASIPCQRAPMPAVLLSQWWPGTGDNEAKIITRLRCRIACGTVAEDETQCADNCLSMALSSSHDLSDTNPDNCSTIGCGAYLEIRESLTDRLLPQPSDVASTLKVNPSMGSTTQAAYTVVVSSLDTILLNESTTIYLLRVMVMKEDGSLTTFYRPMMSRKETLSLLPFSCQNISIAYSTVKKFSTTEFSRPTQVCVDEGLPGPPNKLSFSIVTEDLRPNFIRHAIVNVSWDQPQGGIRSIQYYSLQMESVDQREGERHQHCQDQKILNLTAINEKSTSIIVLARNGELTTPPTFECSYNIKMKSHPGIGEVLQNVQVKYEEEESWINFTCQAHFNLSTAKYDIIGRWNISHTRMLAAETIAESVEVYRVELVAVFNRFPSDANDFFPDRVTVRDGRLEYEHVYYGKKPIKSGEGVYRFKVIPIIAGEYFWRRPLLNGKIDSCERLAPPMPPSEVLNVVAENVTFFNANKSVVFNMLWSPPMYPNGEITQFELHLSTQAISPTAEVILGANTLREIVNKTWREKIVNAFVPFIFVKNSANILYLQMRSMNNYSLNSVWSEPILLIKSDAVISAPPPNNNTEVGKSLPVFAYPLFAVAGIILLVVLAIPIVVFYRSCCIHRGLKLGPEWIPMSLANKFSLQHARSHTLTDKWELFPEEINISKGNPLGTGCFGVVYKGVVRRQTVSAGQNSMRKKRLAKLALPHAVAIKTLKEHATGSEKASFLKEIDMMKKVSETENELGRFVVNMVGCVTEREPLLLVIEYVKYGSLLFYLRSIRKQGRMAYFNSQHSEEVDTGPVPYLEPNGVYSKLDPIDEQYAGLGVLEDKDLLEFARQIAAGMEFLSSLDIIHRDLACRNILIGERKNIKITDFGMSRYVPGDEVYVITSRGLLPLRWMAVESLYLRQFTSASDIWSYGIVLWEICTLGGFPYPLMSNNDLLQRLKRGYRLERPRNCSEEVYDVMLLCWDADPINRPKFSELRNLFDQFRSRYTQEQYPYIDLVTSFSIFQHQQEKLSCDEDNASPVTFEEDTEAVGCILKSQGSETSSCYNHQFLPPPENRLSILSMQESAISVTFDSNLHLSSSSLDIADEPNFRYVPSPVHGSYIYLNTPPDPEYLQLQKRSLYLSPKDTRQSRTQRSRSASPPSHHRCTVTRSLPDVMYTCSYLDEECLLSEETAVTHVEL